MTAAGLEQQGSQAVGSGLSHCPAKIFRTCTQFF